MVKGAKIHQWWPGLLLFVWVACASKVDRRRLEQQVDSLHVRQAALKARLLHYRDSLQQPRYAADQALLVRYQDLLLQKEKVAAQLDSLNARLQSRVTAINNAPPD